MIIASSLFIFLALFLIVLGVHIIGAGNRRAEIRRRLELDAGLPDALDPSILREQRLSSISLLSRVLHSFRLARRLEILLIQAGMSMKVSVFLLMSLSLALLTGLLTHLLAHHLLLAIFAGASAAALSVMLVAIRKERRVRAFNEHFPDAIDLMVNALRAGFAVNNAFQMVADEAPNPVGGEFRIVVEEQKLGLDTRQALMNLGERMDSTDAALFVTAVLIQRNTGGNLTEVLEKIAFVIRDRFRILGEIRTFTAQGRLTGFILGALPVVMAILLTLLSPDYMRILIDTRAGSILVSVAIGLQVLGFLVIRKIIDIRI